MAQTCAGNDCRLVALAPDRRLPLSRRFVSCAFESNRAHSLCSDLDRSQSTLTTACILIFCSPNHLPDAHSSTIYCGLIWDGGDAGSIADSISPLIQPRPSCLFESTAWVLLACEGDTQTTSLSSGDACFAVSVGSLSLSLSLSLPSPLCSCRLVRIFDHYSFDRPSYHAAVTDCCRRRYGDKFQYSQRERASVISIFLSHSIRCSIINSLPPCLTRSASASSLTTTLTSAQHKPVSKVFSRALVVFGTALTLACCFLFSLKAQDHLIDDTVAFLCSNSIYSSVAVTLTNQRHSRRKASVVSSSFVVGRHYYSHIVFLKSSERVHEQSQRLYTRQRPQAVAQRSRACRFCLWISQLTRKR